VLGIKLRAGLLGVLAMLALGAFSATPAFAEGGPFCHHSKDGITDDGLIKAQAPEQIEGPGGVQRFEGKINGSEFIKLGAPGVQVKGIIYNNKDQCQAKLEIQYQPIKVEPEGAHCKASLPNNNVVKLYAHAAWKWRGSESEQVEKPIRQGRDWIFTPNELQQNAKELPKNEVITVMNLENNGGTCLLASKQNKVTGTVFAEAKPAGLGEFRKEEELTVLPNGTLQQFWNGTYPLIGAESGLKFTTEPEAYSGSFKVKPIGRQQQEPQFIGFFES
jgi:hypothetical protein